MANLALLTNPEEMRETASAVDTLKEDFESLRASLQAAITQELNSTCKGEVADEFTKFFDNHVNTALVNERERLEGVIATLKSSAGGFESTSENVMSDINRRQF